MCHLTELNCPLLSETCINIEEKKSETLNVKPSLLAHYLSFQIKKKMNGMIPFQVKWMRLLLKK